MNLELFQLDKYTGSGKVLWSPGNHVFQPKQMLASLGDQSVSKPSLIIVISYDYSKLLNFFSQKEPQRSF